MFDPTELSSYANAVKSALDILKSAKDLIPKGKDKDAITHKIEEAEQALKRADAKLAKELGYTLCECTFPPQIMLWQEKRQLFVCQNAECGRTLPRGMAISAAALAEARRPRRN